MKKFTIAGVILAGALLLGSCATSKTAESGAEPDTSLKIGSAGCTTVAYKLPSVVESGTVVKVDISGKNTGKTGFRSWLIDDNQTTNSNQYTTSLFNSFKDLGGTMGSGPFSFSYELTSTAPSTNLFLKAPSWNTKIQEIEIDAVSVTINGTTTTFVPSDGVTGD
jgi:hypothetical protein